MPEETTARTDGAGIWGGQFVPPWDWRRGDRLGNSAANHSEPGDCAIKGNINREGERIYHVTDGRWYGRTKITEAKGERWFFNEAEARAAGSRPSNQ